MQSASKPATNLSQQDRDRFLRVEALARRGRTGVMELVGLLDDRSWAVRRAVVAALARLGDEAVAPLSDVMRSQRDQEGRLAAAVDALSASRGDVLSTMMALTGPDSPPPVVCDAIQVLGRRKERAALPAIARLAMHDDDNIGVAAIEAMGRIGGVETVEPLLTAMRSRSFFRTFPAIDALGRTRDPRAIAPLVELLSDPLYAAEATRALGRTGQDAAVAALAPALVRHNDPLLRTTALALADVADHYEVKFGSTGSLASSLRAAVRPAEASGRVAECFAAATSAEQVAMTRVLGWLCDDLAIAKLIALLDAETVLAHTAAAALRSIGAAATPHLLEALRHADSKLRARLLPLVGVANVAVGDLANCLEDRDPSVRVLACEALARSGNTTVVPAVFRLLGDPDLHVSQAAAWAIQSLGSTQTRQLALTQARGGEPRARRAALRIVSYFGYAEGLDVLMAAMGDPDDRIREAAIAGLPLLDDARATDALLAASAHENEKTRAAAARALGSTNARNAATVLRQLLGDADPWVRYYACQSLAKLRVRDAADEIVARIDDEAGQVRVAAVEALAYVGTPRALQALAVAAESRDPDIRRAALHGLGTVHDPGTLPLLRAALTSGDASMRMAAVSAIAEFDLHEVVPVLAHAATDPHEGVSSSAIGFLSTRGGEPATKALVELLSDPSARERALAALAVTTEGRTETILVALERADADLAAMLVSALVRMRRPSAVAAIAAVLSFENVHARRAAASALAAIGTREAIDALARCSSSDLDPEVRRIALAAARAG